MYILFAIHRFVDHLLDRYRPELHYMRGPGPKWLERHASSRTNGND
jgi:hypothetical protein